MRARPVDRWLPLLLALGWALFVFWPSRGSVTGAGEDVAFNVWAYELVWHRLAQAGPLWFLHPAAWHAPIFGGYDLGLALSENQLWPALLLWPLRAASGSAALSLQVGGLAWTFLAAVCTAGWLRALGLRWTAGWGGLLVAASGWLQCESVAHVQNQCVFVLPLCFWALERLLQRPGAGRALLFGVSVGWLPGWNLYFFVFAAVTAAVRLGLALRRRELGRGELVLAGLAAAVCAAPILRPYLELSARLSTYGTGTVFAASVHDLIGRIGWPGLFAPAAQGAEPGALGRLFLLLAALAVLRRGRRGWLVAALLALWIALGDGLSASTLTTALPVVQALRAVGRATLLVLLFALPPVLSFLEMLPRGPAALLLALCCLETLPRGGPPQVPAADGFEAGAALARATANLDSLLVLPQAGGGAMVQLALVAHELPLHGGLSGRWPPGHDLLQHLARRDVDPAELAAFCGTRHLLLRSPGLVAWASARPEVAAAGCFPEGCRFDLPERPVQRLDLARQARWTVAQGPEPVAELRASGDGVLSASSLDRCRLRRTLRWGALALRRDQSFPSGEVEGVRFRAGERIVRHEVRLKIFRLPARLRPALELETICE